MMGDMTFEEPGVNTQIEQADQALHPSAKGGIMGLVMKARITPETKPFIDHIMSRAIQRNKFDILGDGNQTEYNAADALAMSDFLTSIAVNGQGREDLIQMVSQIPRPTRPGFLGGRGGTYSNEIGQ